MLIARQADDPELAERDMPDRVAKVMADKDISKDIMSYEDFLQKAQVNPQ